MNYEAMGLKYYRGIVMPLSYYLAIDDRNHDNRLRTISPSVSPADHEIPIPPPSTDKSKMLPLPTPPTKRKDNEKDGSNVGGFFMDLAEDGSEDGTSTPTEKHAGMTLPAPTKKNSGTISPAPTKTDANPIPPAPTETEACTTQPAPTGNEAGTTPEKPTDPH